MGAATIALWGAVLGLTALLVGTLSDQLTAKSIEPQTPPEVVEDRTPDQPSSDQPPSDQPPLDQPPLDQPPLDQPPLDQPPLDQPPLDQPPLDQPLRFHPAMEDALEEVVSMLEPSGPRRS